jgi:hypothetical protein
VKKFKVRLELKCNYLYRDFDILGADVANAKQYLYDPMIDKINKIKTNTMNLIK